MRKCAYIRGLNKGLKAREPLRRGFQRSGWLRRRAIEKNGSRAVRLEKRAHSKCNDPLYIRMDEPRSKSALPHRYQSAAPLPPLRALTDVPQDVEG